MPEIGQVPGLAGAEAADLVVGRPGDGAIRLAARGDGIGIGIGQTRAYTAPVFTGAFRTYTVRRGRTGGGGEP